MLTAEDVESPASEPSEGPQHLIHPPDLSLQATYYPFGFPCEVRTNSEWVLKQYEEIWGKFHRQRDTESLRADVILLDSGGIECPPEPTYRVMMPLMTCVADRDNYSIVDLDSCRARITISRAAQRHRLYAQYFLLGTPVSCICTRYTTPVHAGCVALEGRGMLLCGESGAGKSTLSYACARAGFTYVSDDGSFLLNGGSERLVTGNCYQVRFRPSAAQLFPEIEGLEITPRAAGKPSIELPTAELPQIVGAQTTPVDFIVFLNRQPDGPPQLLPYRKDVARQYMQQVLYGPAESLAAQYRAIDRLLTAEVFELRYSGFNWAVDRLRKLVQKGR